MDYAATGGSHYYGSSGPCTGQYVVTNLCEASYYATNVIQDDSTHYAVVQSQDSPVVSAVVYSEYDDQGQYQLKEGAIDSLLYCDVSIVVVRYGLALANGYVLGNVVVGQVSVLVHLRGDVDGAISLLVY